MFVVRTDPRALFGRFITASASGKTLGSLLVFHVGQEAKRTGPVVRRLRRSRFDVLE